MDHDPLGGLGDEDDEDDREEDAASPWTGAGGRRGPQYTHDLGKGLRPNDFQSDAEEEDEDESEAEEEMDSKNDATPVQGSASIFERRRPSEAVHLAEPSAVEKSEETSSTAPPEQLAPSLQGEDAFKSANWSEGDSTFGSGSGGEGGLTGVVEQHKLTQLVSVTFVLLLFCTRVLTLRKTATGNARVRSCRRRTKKRRKIYCDSSGTLLHFDRRASSAVF